MNTTIKTSAILLSAILLGASVATAQTQPEVQKLPFKFSQISGEQLPAWLAVHESPRADYEPASGTSSEAPTAPGTGDVTPFGETTFGWEPYKNGIAIAAHDRNEGKRVRGVVVAIDTKGKDKVQVKYTSVLIKETAHNNAMALQYRVGTTGDFTTLPNTAFNNATTAEGGVKYNTKQTYTVNLPAEACNQPLVQLRWVYYMTCKGEKGARERIGLFDVEIK